ncbi:MAG: BMP family ABC transporter substrate-binding protein [Lachnospiraceae bacterium]|nr:BMP family ABC transporter substrate-binding protein [Lachnospiraceae bacterium]
MNKRKTLGIGISAICVIALIVLVIVFVGNEKKAEGAKVGFVMSGGIEESGWNGMHYEGIKAACEKLGANLLVRENVREFTGQCNTAVKELAEEGAEMIILSSYGYSEEVKDLVKEYPEIVFYVNSSEYHDANMTSYFARMYQARYLSGIVAGMKTQSQKIGYVAAMENNEVNRGINAFTRGVRRVNPEAEVVVIWTGEWDNREKEIAAAKDLIEQEKADVLTYHQNQPNVVEAAELSGVYSIGYHEALEGFSSKYLTSVVCNWESVYYEIVREFLIGNGNQKNNYWIGLEADAVGVSAYSEEITKKIQTEIEQAKTEILNGKDVFSGTIYDVNGHLRCGEMEIIGDEQLLEQMDWFVEGVEFYEE